MPATVPVRGARFRFVVVVLTAVLVGRRVAYAEAAVAPDDPAIEQVFQELLEEERQRTRAVDVITLVTGKKLRGRILERTEETVRFENPRGIKISLPAKRVASVERGDPVEPSAARKAELRAEAADAVATFRSNLAEPIALEYEPVKLGRLAAHLTEVTSVRIRVDPALAQKRVTPSREEMPFREALDQLARAVGGRLVVHARSVAIVQ